MEELSFREHRRLALKYRFFWMEIIEALGFSKECQPRKHKTGEVQVICIACECAFPTLWLKPSGRYKCVYCDLQGDVIGFVRDALVSREKNTLEELYAFLSRISPIKMPARESIQLPLIVRA